MTETAADKRNAFGWAALKRFDIIDDDGWRHDNTSLYKLLTEEEFDERAAISTIRPW